MVCEKCKVFFLNIHQPGQKNLDRLATPEAWRDKSVTSASVRPQIGGNKLLVKRPSAGLEQLMIFVISIDLNNIPTTANYAALDCPMQRRITVKIAHIIRESVLCVEFGCMTCLSIGSEMYRF
jgi:hypothetical protein